MEAPRSSAFVARGAGTKYAEPSLELAERLAFGCAAAVVAEAS
jgi:hypothetical protein